MNRADDEIDPYDEPPSNEAEAADRLESYEELTLARSLLHILLVKDDLARQNRKADDEGN